LDVFKFTGEGYNSLVRVDERGVVGVFNYDSVPSCWLLRNLPLNSGHQQCCSLNTVISKDVVTAVMNITCHVSDYDGVVVVVIIIIFL